MSDNKTTIEQIGRDLAMAPRYEKPAPGKLTQAQHAVNMMRMGVAEGLKWEALMVCLFYYQNLIDPLKMAALIGINSHAFAYWENEAEDVDTVITSVESDWLKGKATIAIKTSPDAFHEFMVVFHELMSQRSADFPIKDPILVAAQTTV